MSIFNDFNDFNYFNKFNDLIVMATFTFGDRQSCYDTRDAIIVIWFSNYLSQMSQIENIVLKKKKKKTLLDFARLH